MNKLLIIIMSLVYAYLLDRLALKSINVYNLKYEDNLFLTVFNTLIGAFLLFGILFKVDRAVFPHIIMASSIILSSSTDLRTMLIPNKFMYMPLLLILIYRLIKSKDISFYLISTISIFLILLIVFIFSNKSIGIGDLKLYLVISLTLGIVKSLESLIFSSIIAIVYILIMSISKNKKLNSKLPFVPFIVLGTSLTYFFNIYKYTLP